MSPLRGARLSNHRSHSWRMPFDTFVFASHPLQGLRHSHRHLWHRTQHASMLLSTMVLGAHVGSLGKLVVGSGAAVFYFPNRS